MLCISLIENSLEDLEKQVARHLSAKDLILEIRLDFIERVELKVSEVLSLTRKYFHQRFILTLRSFDQGGHSYLSSEKRSSFYKNFLDEKNLILDLEFHLDQSLLMDKFSKKAALLASYHGSMEGLKECLKLKERVHADYFKWALNFPSSLEALQTTQALSGPNTICLSLFKEHAFLRAMYRHYQMPWMYCYDARASNAAHPSQLSMQALRRNYQVQSIDLKTKYFALIGDPVDKSFSDVSHNRFFRVKKINARYVKIPVKKSECSAFLEYCKRHKLFQGFSVTMPLKEALSEHLHDHAKGAFNTLVLCDNKEGRAGFMACNTDGLAVEECVREKFIKSSAKIAILGAGGCAKAIAKQLAESYSNIWVFNRSASNLSYFEKELKLKVEPLDNLQRCVEDEGFELIINATSVGMLDDYSLVDESSFRQDCIYMDAVAKPRWTKMLRLAKEKKASCITGKRMFFKQALKQWEFYCAVLASKPQNEPLLSSHQTSL